MDLEPPNRNDILDSCEPSDASGRGKSPSMSYLFRNISHSQPAGRSSNVETNQFASVCGKDGVDLERNFTFIEDIVKGCVASLNTAGKSTGSGGKKTGPAPYRIFNLGNTSPVTVPTVVSILERYLKVKATIIQKEMPGNGDVPFTHANISLARTELGYKPTTDLESGLKRFVKWYMSYYGYRYNGNNPSR